MMNNNTLLVRFNTDTQAEWLVAGSCGQGLPSELAELAPGRRIILVVPSEAVLLTHATLPQRNRATWLKSLPYALEDSLADEVEELHFAMGTTYGDQATIAVLRHTVMQGWLAQCAKVGIMPNAIIPDCLLLPISTDAWSLLFEGERVVVRNGQASGFACERHNLMSLLTLALDEAGEQPPETLQVWGEPLTTLTDLRPISGQQKHAEPVLVFATGLETGIELDLLQGVYSRRAQLSKWLRPWRLTAALAACWLGLQVAGQTVEYWRLNSERNLLQAQMEQVYRKAVPGAQRIVNPRAQLENHLRELRGNPSNVDTAFLDLLQDGGQLIAASPGVRLHSLRYNNQQLDFNLTGNSLDTLEQLRQKLAEQPDLETNMRTTKREDQVESLLTLRKAAL